MILKIFDGLKARVAHKPECRVGLCSDRRHSEFDRAAFAVEAFELADRALDVVRQIGTRQPVAPGVEQRQLERIAFNLRRYIEHRYVDAFLSPCETAEAGETGVRQSIVVPCDPLSDQWKASWFGVDEQIQIVDRAGDHQPRGQYLRLRRGRGLDVEER